MNIYIGTENLFLVASDNHLIVNLDASKIITTKEMMSYLSEKLNFPSYFANNLNSFEECINDLEWLSEKKIVLIIKNSDVLLS